MDSKDKLKSTKINKNIVKSHNYLSRVALGKNPDGSMKYKYVYADAAKHYGPKETKIKRG